MNLRQLGYFIVLAEELHFGRAAKRLHLAQPALSGAIRRLEASIGAELLDRGSRHVALTPAGEALLPRARAIVATAEEAMLAARLAQDGRSGQLRIGYSPAARMAYARLLQAFGAEHERVSIAGREAISPEQLSEVRERRVDIALAIFPQRVDGLCYRRLKDMPLVAVVASDHPLASRESVALAELGDECLLVLGDSHVASFNEYAIQLCLAAGFDPVVETLPNHFDTQFTRVADGEGFTLLIEDFAASAADLGDVEVVSLEGDAVVPLELIWREDDLSAVGERFLEFALAFASSEGWLVQVEKASPRGH